MRAGHLSPDTLDFIRCLYEHRVKYLLVGGEAVIYYGYPRLTGDVDFYYDRSADNCSRLYGALMDFWKQDVPGIAAAAALEEAGAIFQFGVPPNRIDLINTIDGVSFHQAWEGRETTGLELADASIDVLIIGLDELIQNKESSKRHKDLDDLEYLREVRLKRKQADP